jgi:FMN-dependent NADH-azoreductase
MSKKLVIDVETGEVIEREMNAEEIAQLEADKANTETEKEAEAAKAAEKAAAIAKLAALGLTEDDLKALGLGGN